MSQYQVVIGTDPGSAMIRENLPDLTWETLQMFGPFGASAQVYSAETQDLVPVRHAVEFAGSVIEGEKPRALILFTDSASWMIAGDTVRPFDSAFAFKEGETSLRPHYAAMPCEPFDIWFAMGIDTEGYLSNLVKYVMRRRYKGQYDQDTDKALSYVQCLRDSPRPPVDFDALDPDDRTVLDLRPPVDFDALDPDDWTILDLIMKFRTTEGDEYLQQIEHELRRQRWKNLSNMQS